MIRKRMKRFKTNEEQKHVFAGDEGIELTMLSAINAIVSLAEDSHLSSLFFEMAKNSIDYLCERQDLTPIQAVLLSLFIEASASGNNADFSDIAEYLDCNNVQVFQYKGEVDDMVKKGLLRQTKSRMTGETNYCIPLTVLEAMASNEPFQRKSYKNSTGIELFQHFYDITHLRHENELSSELLWDEVQRLLDENPQLPYVKALRMQGMTPVNETIITHMCRHLVLSGVDSLDFGHLVFLFDCPHMRNEFGRTFTDGTHYLIKNGWVENAFSEGFREREEFRLTNKARECLLKDYNIKTAIVNTGCDVLLNDTIDVKELFFSDKVNHQLDSLAELLDESHYLQICNRLKERGLRQGFTCLFYGVPGTGKTESVLQLARKTGRDIMQVNISEVKSMWVGESEKNIKAIFDRYRAVAKHSKRIPILLFNEADAIIGKRTKGAERAVDRMENSIQNIILQEMESLEGIMIATTNLIENMDSAFERRFLYKVKFEKPEPAQRAMIWRSLLPEISAESAERLASAYDFSGGQIENITRKCDVERILYGEDFVNDEKIEQYCDEELITKKEIARIGFV